MTERNPTPQRLRVTIESPGDREPRRVELDAGGSAVVGRAPEAARSPEVAGAAPQRVTLESPVVSGTQLAIATDGVTARVVDVGSRNGTWMKLPPHTVVSLPVPTDPLELGVASATSAEPPDVPSVEWSGPDDYATALRSGIAEWLERQSLDARITLVASGAHRAERIGRFPLATGSDLSIESSHTVGHDWVAAMTILGRFVAEQNLLFETEETLRDEGLVVASPAMRRAVARVIEAAASGARVLLLTGPSGAGKEGLARCFHRHTGRSGPFVTRSCAMFSRELVRSELFGAEKGSFTGSVGRIVGAVEMANAGTLFLDEVGELPRDVQPMLLRFLDHGEYERLGHVQTKNADVRIVAATNRDLRAASVSEAFRTDLWFRLSVHVVTVPPLRERPEDIVAYLQSRGLARALGPGALEVLQQHEWQGNFRELTNFVARALPLAQRGSVSADAALALLQEGAIRPVVRAATPTPAPDDTGAALVGFVGRARDAYAHDHGGDPQSWDEIKDFMENYAKPVLFAELSGTSQLASLGEVDLRVASERLRADRGTAQKQLRRYFDRFRP